METLLDWALLFAFVSLAATTSLNALRFSQESEYLKRKYIDRGYWKGYRQAEKDCEILANLRDKK